MALIPVDLTRRSFARGFKEGWGAAASLHAGSRPVPEKRLLRARASSGNPRSEGDSRSTDGGTPGVSGWLHADVLLCSYDHSRTRSEMCPALSFALTRVQI